MFNFQEETRAHTARVPRGKITTYAAIARAIGKPRAARAVGNVLNKNEDMVHVPCHRVVRSDGSVGGYAHGTAKKIAKLRAEGVEIKNGRVDLGRFGYSFEKRSPRSSCT